MRTEHLFNILLDGYWEKWITDIFLGLVSKNMVVCDIGANIGYYSLLAASLIGDSGKLYSFEANPEIFDVLFRNIEINGFLDRTELINKAVFSKKCKLEFNVPERHHGSSSVFNIDLNNWHDSSKKVTIDAISLDDFFEKKSKVDLIKIDAEGSESEILKGAARVLSENNDIVILMEWAPKLIEGSGSSPEEIWRFLKEFGFNFYYISHDSLLLKKEFDFFQKIDHCDVVIKRG